MQKKCKKSWTAKNFPCFYEICRKVFFNWIKKIFWIIFGIFLVFEKKISVWKKRKGSGLGFFWIFVDAKVKRALESFGKPNKSRNQKINAFATFFFSTWNFLKKKFRCCSVFFGFFLFSFFKGSFFFLRFFLRFF